MRRGPDAEDLERQKTVLQLNSLLMAWWEGSEDERADNYAGAASTDQCTSDAKAYHLRTRLPEKCPGLLVDPGAHDNLVGDRTAARMEEVVGVPAKQLRMNKALSVEGLGKNAQSAAVAKRMTVRRGSDDGDTVEGSFTAPVIADSDLPPLLGLRSLKSFKRAINKGSLIVRTRFIVYKPVHEPGFQLDFHFPFDSLLCRRCSRFHFSFPIYPLYNLISLNPEPPTPKPQTLHPKPHA